MPHGFGHPRKGLRRQQAGKPLGAGFNDLILISALDEPSGNAALNGVRVWVEAI